MKRRELLTLLGGAAAAAVSCSVSCSVSWPLAARAQEGARIPRIGYLSGTGSSSDPGPYVEALRQGLRDLGHVEGRNISIEYRGAEGKEDRISGIVTELVQLKPDVLVLPFPSAIRAAKRATDTIPIVMVTSADPVATGMVQSLARPGGNITGLFTLTQDLSAKRLELLKEMVPGISRVGVLRDAEDPDTTIRYKEHEAAARALQIELQSLDVRGPTPDLEGAFRAAVEWRAGALITITNTLLYPHRGAIADLAIRNQMPTTYQGRAWVEAGGLMSYSANDLQIFRRAAYYVDKILKGANPADLPVEQPTRFELVINLKTAKALGLTIPPSLLGRADQVIE
jgi:putative tryptophan/tyrosine transport system substrate-binding protein